MYVDLLSKALQARSEEHNADEWLDLALEYRDRMLGSRLQRGESSGSVLADDVAYDRALIRLCAAKGIGAAPERFAQPVDERRRLEQELAAMDLDLSALGRIRRRI